MLNLTKFVQLALALSGSGAAASASSSPAFGAPTVTLDNATVTGFTNASVTSFRGIPFAQPPTGALRLRPPVPVAPYTGTFDATPRAAQCPQLALTPRPDLPAENLADLTAFLTSQTSSSTAPQDEDCLTVAVQVPEGTKPGDKLPVLAFIYGGAFAVGATDAYPADAVVRRSAELGEPVVFVSMNYRLSVFGFLGGKEVKEAGVGNLGLQDQREALRWINKYISAFGGDPTKVTLWGHSAGAISIAAQLLTHGGDPAGLFRGAIMHSGATLPSGDLAGARPQAYYDAVVAATGCAGAADTLECLRAAPADALVAAGSALPSIFSVGGIGATVPWGPRADGLFLEKPMQELVKDGKVARVPIINTDVLDEGPLFAVSSFNITTDDDFRAFVQEWFYPSAPKEVLEKILELYPNDPAKGSPFGTGDDNQLSPQYKRASAFEGDAVFDAPRRFFLDHIADKQPAWSYISERDRFTGLGVPHGSDFQPLLATGNDLADYVIRFAATLDPNGGASNRTIEWPRYYPTSRKVLRVLSGDVPLAVGEDNARRNATATLSALGFDLPF